MANRALIEALSGAPVGRGRAFAAAGLDPAGTAVIRRNAAIREAKRKAHQEGSGPTFTEKALRSVGQAYLGPIGMAEPFVHDSADTPTELRAPSNMTTYGHSAERRTQQREELMGEDVPGYAKSYSTVQGKLPGYAPMIDAAGAFSGRGAAMNALSAALMLAAAPAGPAAASESATADLAARGVDFGVREAGAAAAANAGRAGAARMLGTGAGAFAPDLLTGPAARNPYSRAGVSAAASLGTSLLEPSAAVGKGADLGVLGDTLFAPASLVPEGVRESIGSLGRSTLGALPNVATTSRDVLGALQAQRRSRFRALLRGGQQAVGNQVADPFGLIPDVSGGFR